MNLPFAGLSILVVSASCSSFDSHPAGSFAAEEAFLGAHTRCISLPSGTGMVAVAPELQGRVMTSALSRGERALGFVNHAVVAEPAFDLAFVNYGGEDRFWMGPEGGPYALFFDPGQPRTLEHWRAPHDLNWAAFAVTSFDQQRVSMESELSLRNGAGTEFQVGVRRTVEVPSRGEIEALCGELPPDAQWVAFRSRNQVTNRGAQAWRKDSGLPCVWILGMFESGPRTWVVAPFRSDPSLLSKPVEDRYFGSPPADRLKIGPSFALFRGDGRWRSKIGVLRDRALPVIGAYDPDREVLTVVQLAPLDPSAPYLNELWELDGADPYHGDVVNSYNHGGPESFFELETSSPALALEPGQSHEHNHLTIHLRLPDETTRARVFERALGVSWGDFTRYAGR